MTVMNPKQIKKIHKIWTPPFTTEVAVIPDVLKFRKQTTIFSFSALFCLHFVTIWPCGCFSWPTPPFAQRRDMARPEGHSRPAVVLWPDESPVEQAGLRCLWLALIAVSSSALGLVALGFAEGKFSERISPSNYFLYLPFPHFCHLMNVALIAESRREKL